MYFEELTHTAVGTGESKVCRAGQRLGDSVGWGGGSVLQS